LPARWVVDRRHLSRHSLSRQAREKMPGAGRFGIQRPAGDFRQPGGPLRTVSYLRAAGTAPRQAPASISITRGSDVKSAISHRASLGTAEPRNRWVSTEGNLRALGKCQARMPVTVEYSRVSA
jgi:hypothetical protein